MKLSQNQLSKDLLLKTNDSGAIPFDAPPWPTVYLKLWTGQERQQFFNWTREQAKDEEVRQTDTVLHAYICHLGLCDKDGQRLFSDGDEKLLMLKSATVLRQIAEAILEHNGVTRASREETRENFRVTPSDASGSASLAS
jgi:hypothetical protein